MASKREERNPHIIIIGCGVSGIASGVALKRQLGFDNFTIYEKSSGVGGTWRFSTYPGCAADIPGHWYSLSSDLKPDWPTYYPTQPEVLAYWEDLWRKHDLPRNTVLNTSVVESEWDASRELYYVKVKNENTGETETVEAHFLIYGLGGFMAPQYPKEMTSLAGLNFGDFKGPVWHSATWKHDVDLRNKRVAVIGNGCSGAQIVPALSEDPSITVVNFIRSAQWLVPRNNFRYRSITKWIFEHIPFVMRWHRNLIMARADVEFLIFRESNRRMREMARKGLTSYIKAKAPEALWDKLTPQYPVGAKQIIVDPDYLSSFNRPNVLLEDTPIASLVENGIKLQNGEIVPVDIVVFATGYSLEPENLAIKGINGKTIRQYFDEQGGPTAYLGCNFPGFPNLCYIIGPNAATGHASLLFDMEAQIRLAVQLAKPIIEGQAHSITISKAVTDEYNKWLQDRIATSVWPACESYYYVNGTRNTKNIAIFPGPATLFWWKARKPKWEEWEVRGGKAEQWKTSVKGWKQTRVLGISALVAGVMAWLIYWDVAI